MRAYDNGCFFTVVCSEREVQAFARRGHAWERPELLVSV